MTQLIYLRRQFKDTAAAYQSATAERERFAKQRWLSRTAWDRLGYAVRDGETSGIILVFSTPRGAEPYTAYHASQVELRPGVWRKMVRCCPNVPVSLSPEQRAHRAEVYSALVGWNEEKLADRLLPSLVTRREIDEDRAHLDWLDHRIRLAEESLAAAKKAYQEVWLPVVQRRQLSMRRRELLNDLATLEVVAESLPEEVTVAELEDLLRRKRAEIQRQSDLHELTRLGVDVSTLPTDLSSEALSRLVQRRQRQTEPRRVRRVLRMTGIDPESLPDSIDPRDVIDLVEDNGYLATVPADLSSDDRLANLRSRGKRLAVWACEQYPRYVSEEVCFRSPGRVKLIFRKPSRAEEPRRNSRVRPRRHVGRARIEATSSWQAVGF